MASDVTGAPGPGCVGGWPVRPPEQRAAGSGSLSLPHSAPSDLEPGLKRTVRFDLCPDGGAMAPDLGPLWPARCQPHGFGAARHRPVPQAPPPGFAVRAIGATYLDGCRGDERRLRWLLQRLREGQCRFHIEPPMTGAPATCRQVTAWEGAGSDIAAQPPSLDRESCPSPDAGSLAVPAVRSLLKAGVSPGPFCPKDTGPCLRTSVVVTPGGLVALVGAQGCHSVPQCTARRRDARPRVPCAAGQGPCSRRSRGRGLVRCRRGRPGHSRSPGPPLSPTRAAALLAGSRSPSGSGASRTIPAGAAGGPRNRGLGAWSATSRRSGPSRPHGDRAHVAVGGMQTLRGP